MRHSLGSRLRVVSPAAFVVVARHVMTDGVGADSWQLVSGVFVGWSAFCDDGSKASDNRARRVVPEPAVSAGRPWPLAMGEWQQCCDERARQPELHSQRCLIHEGSPAWLRCL